MCDDYRCVMVIDEESEKEKAEWKFEEKHIKSNFVIDGWLMLAFSFTMTVISTLAHYTT